MPAWLLPAAMIGGGIFNSILGNNASNDQNKLSREQLELQKVLAALGGANSAGLNPAMERQKMALMHALLGNARPMSVTPPAHIARSMPKIQGGVGIPEGGFSPETLKFTSPNSLFTQESTHLANLKQLFPSLQTPDLSTVGHTPQLIPATPEKRDEVMRRALSGRIRGEEGGRVR